MPKNERLQNGSQSLRLAGAVLLNRLGGQIFQAATSCITFDILVPKQTANLGEFFVAELCDGAFDFLDGAHNAENRANPFWCKPRISWRQRLFYF